MLPRQLHMTVVYRITTITTRPEPASVRTCVIVYYRYYASLFLLKFLSDIHILSLSRPHCTHNPNASPCSKLGWKLLVQLEQLEQLKQFELQCPFSYVAVINKVPLSLLSCASSSFLCAFGMMDESDINLSAYMYQMRFCINSHYMPPSRLGQLSTSLIWSHQCVFMLNCSSDNMP